MHYQILVADMGKFRDSSSYEFVAEFADHKLTQYHVHYLRRKKRFAKKDIIIKEVSDTNVDKPGKIAGVITVLGEALPIEEYTFT